MSRKITIPGPIGALAERIGVGTLAAQCGVTAATLTGWAKGLHRPSAITQQYLRQLLAAHHLPAPDFKQRVYPSTTE